MAEPIANLVCTIDSDLPAFGSARVSAIEVWYQMFVCDILY